MHEYISKQELFNNAKLIAIANDNQVKNGKSNKSPSINWEKNPPKYKGITDNTYGTAIVCDYIPSLSLYLVVIDLDTQKGPNDISVSKLRSSFVELIESTYCVKTPSGGLHIYLLSKKKPTAKQPKINIDYQANTGNSRGKYVVANFRWDSKGKNKEHYTKLPESHEDILIVNDADKGLTGLIKILEEKGHIKNEVKKLIDEIIKILKPYAKTTEVPSRQYYSCGIAGYLKKQGYKQDIVEEIIREVFSEDEEIQHRVNNVQRTYEKENKDIVGWELLKEYLPKTAQKSLLDLTKNNHDDLKSEIINKLVKHKEPTSKQLFDYVSMNLNLYINLNTLKYYEKRKDGSIIEIDEKRIIEFCIDEFGTESISRKRCIEVLKHIINPIEKDYNLLEFTNGILNTETHEFDKDKTHFNKLPKLSIPFRWNLQAKSEKIGQIIDRILDNPRYPDDKQTFKLAVGHAFMGVNRIGKLTIVTGPTKTGKSTLMTILKRLFKYSCIQTRAINANERFTLYEMIDKDINIDDDINNGVLKGIGHLNTVITGNGLEVEVKGENRSIKADNSQIPRLFACGNTLPPVFGEGFDSRLLLIHAINKISHEERDDKLQNDIILGKYDNDLEWLVYTCINLYWEKEDKPITTQRQEEEMRKQYEFQSYPLKAAIEALFEDDYDSGEYIEVKDINKYLKEWSLYYFKKGEISKEHKRPSNTKIKKAMDHAGYDQGVKKIKAEYDENYDKWFYKSIKVYKEIKLSEKGCEIIGKLFNKQTLM